jgi:cold shock protein
MLTGKVVRFDEARGYGFIAPDRGGEDVFVHANVLGDDKYLFCPGLPVEFETTEGDRGLKAYAVRILADRVTAPLPAAPAAASRPPVAVTATPAMVASVPAQTAAALAQRPARQRDGGEELCDVLTASSLSQELTELFLDRTPTLTGEQITQLRREFVELGKRHGWVED